MLVVVSIRYLPRGWKTLEVIPLAATLVRCVWGIKGAPELRPELQGAHMASAVAQVRNPV